MIENVEALSSDEPREVRDTKSTERTQEVRPVSPNDAQPTPATGYNAAHSVDEDPEEHAGQVIPDPWNKRDSAGDDDVTAPTQAPREDR